MRKNINRIKRITNPYTQDIRITNPNGLSYKSEWTKELWTWLF